MKQFKKLLVTSSLAIILLLSTNIIAFAYDSEDPIGGNCMCRPIEYVRITK